MTLVGRLNQLTQTLRFRLILSFTLLTATVSLLFVTFYIYHEHASAIKKLKQEGTLLARMLKISIQLPLYAENSEEIAASLTGIMQFNTLISVKIRNHDNILLAEIRRPGKTAVDQVTMVRETVFSSDRTLTPESLLFGENKTMPATIGYIEMELDEGAVSSDMRRLFTISIFFGALFWVTASVLGNLFMQRITNSFQLLMDGVKEIEAGNTNTRIPVSSDDEPGRAAKAINDLADALQKRDRENRRLQEELVKSMRIEIRDEKKRMMAKLIDANRMTSLGLLVSSMAHEINNPNGSIRLANEYLKTAWKALFPHFDGIYRRDGAFNLLGMPYSEAKEEILGATDNIARCSSRIEHVIKELRSYSLGERLQITPDLAINKVVMNSLAILHAHGRRNDVSFATELAENIPFVNGNATQIEQVLLNLLLNATQALPPEKRNIRVSTSWDWRTGEVSVTVEDEGKGIAPEDMQRLFDPFFSTRFNEGGSGLGLYIAKFIVEEHGGRIIIDSIPGQGTTVRVTLPAVSPRTGSEPV